jgi:hypothetical protein
VKGKKNKNTTTKDVITEIERNLGSQRVFLELFDVIVESILCYRTHLLLLLPLLLGLTGKEGTWAESVLFVTL